MSETSRKIIEGVTERGAENGMYGMTSKAISKKCECSEGVIFKHFNTLEELKKEVYSTSSTPSTSKSSES